MLNRQQIAQFDQDGAVTIDTPLTTTELETLRDTYDNLFPGPDTEAGREKSRHSRTADFFDQPLVDLIQHPFFEKVAAKALCANAVRFANIALSKTYPRPEEKFDFIQHTDVQYSLSDIDATPRRMTVSFFIWIDDVNEKRAPLMYRRGSHRQIAEWRQRHPRYQNEVPRVHGTTEENLPSLDYEPAQPIVAKAGQVSVLTTALVHGPSTNVDIKSRYACHLSYTSDEFDIELPKPKQNVRVGYYRALRDYLRPDRLHLVGAYRTKK